MCWNSDNCQFDESVLHIGCICVLSIILQAVTQPNFRGPFCKPIFSEKVSSLKIVIITAQNKHDGSIFELSVVQ